MAPSYSRVPGGWPWNAHARHSDLAGAARAYRRDSRLAVRETPYGMVRSDETASPQSYRRVAQWLSLRFFVRCAPQNDGERDFRFIVDVILSASEGSAFSRYRAGS